MNYYVLDTLNSKLCFKASCWTIPKITKIAYTHRQTNLATFQTARDYTQHGTCGHKKKKKKKKKKIIQLFQT